MVHWAFLIPAFAAGLVSGVWLTAKLLVIGGRMMGAVEYGAKFSRFG